MAIQPWHIEEITLDVARPSETATQLIYGRQGDKDSILVKATIQNNGVTLPTEWFAGKNVFFEARGVGMTVRKFVETIQGDTVQFTLPAELFTLAGMIEECFIRIETADGEVIASTSSFRVYSRLGLIDGDPGTYYLEEIQEIVEAFNDYTSHNMIAFTDWLNDIKGTVGDDAAANLAIKVAAINESIGNQLQPGTFNLKPAWSMWEEFEQRQINVKWFGAKGDGVTDDKQAFQNAVNFIASTGGGTIWVPQGTYLLKSGIKWASKVSMTGAGIGRTIFTVSGELFSMIQNTDGAGDGSDGGNPDVWLLNNQFSHFEMDGSGFAYSLAHADGKGIFLLYLKSARFDNIYIHDTIGTGFGCDFLIDTVFNECLAQRCGRNYKKGGQTVGQSGFGIGSCAVESENVIVVNCTARDCGNYGFFVETQQNPSKVKSRDARFIDCLSERNRIGFGNKGSGPTRFTNVTALKNQIGIQLTEGSRGDIIDNAELELNTSSGLYVSADYVGDLKVTNSRIRRNRKGVEMLGGETEMINLAFIGCDISSNSYNGIESWRKIRIFRMLNNLINSNGVAAAAGYKAGISLNAPMRDIQWVSNKFLNQGGTQLTGLETNSTGTLNDGSIMNNDLMSYGPSSGMKLPAARANVRIEGNGGFTERVEGSGSLTSSYDYVSITFPTPFDAAPREVLCYSRGKFPVYATDITRFGFMARTAGEATAVNFDYIAKLQ